MKAVFCLQQFPAGHWASQRPGHLLIPTVEVHICRHLAESLELLSQSHGESAHAYSTYVYAFSDKLASQSHILYILFSCYKTHHYKP